MNDNKEITKLRDAIVNGVMKQVDDVLLATILTSPEDEIVFPVEQNAKEIFIRDFYSVFFDYFLHTVFPGRVAEPGMVCRGPPGVGKVFGCILHFLLIYTTPLNC